MEDESDPISDLRKVMAEIKVQYDLVAPSGTVALFRPDKLATIIKAMEGTIRWVEGSGKTKA